MKSPTSDPTNRFLLILRGLILDLRAEQLGKQAHQQWVRNKLSARGPKPFEFVRTVPSYDPDQPHPSTTLDGNVANVIT